MIKQWINRFTWALLLYLIFLIATLPANLVVTQDKIGNQAKLGNVSGSIWSGKIDAVLVNNILIKDVKWQFNFLQLLTAKAGVDLEFGSKRKILEPQGTGQVAYGFSGILISDWQLSFPSELITQNIRLPIKASASGLVKLTVAEAQLGQPVCSVLSGEINWLNASVNAMKSQIDYGDIKAALSCDKGALVAKVSGNQDVLDLTATAKYQGGNKYSLIGQVAAGDKADAVLVNTLSLLGNKNSQGKYLINLSSG